MIIFGLIISLLIGVSFSQNGLPTTFIMELQEEDTLITDTIYMDAVHGVRIEKLLPADKSYITYLFPNDGNRYTIFSSLFGLMVNQLCFIEPLSTSGPQPFTLPHLTNHIPAAATVDGYTPIDIWALPNSSVWWYTYNTSVGVFFPAGWADNQWMISVVKDFSLAQPAVQMFVPPDCYSTYSSSVALERRRNIPVFVWPDSFSLTLTNSTITTNLLVNAVSNSQRTEESTIIPSNPLYTRYTTSINHTTYYYDNWFDIQPPPCVFITQAISLWSKPNLGYIGDLNEVDMDIYAAPGDNRWWFIEGNTIPFGVASSSTSWQITNFMAVVPPMSAFQVPSLCFPAYGSNMTQNYPIGAVPILPPVFVLYAVRSYAPFPLVIYYDGTHGNIRIDNGVASVLQLGNDVYTFSSDINSPITPTPCQHKIITTPIYTLPQFTRRVANVTYEDFPVSVWVTYIPKGTLMEAQYWYFDNTSIPLMYTSISGSTKINFFGTLPPPPTVFTIPPQCQLIPKEKNTFIFSKERTS